ncbi:hypothetical protein B4135_3172 [Caldibacillus debilis]|uniref:Transposase IS204/IS1001/IS1096/IS1165 zinc-finger domain-containing protein n=1 Tax=Caldibacillus debilis TaxID=301148 RepID=A0A150LGY5_9BACI|nr:hypothetical protein B4135_3172 [Caldibacillus debilis]
MNHNIFLPGLKDVKINKVETGEHSIHLYVEMPVKPHRRPRCGTEGRRIHDYRIQKIRHLKWFEPLTVISTGKENMLAKHAENGSRNKIRLWSGTRQTLQDRMITPSIYKN